MAKLIRRVLIVLAALTVASLGTALAALMARAEAERHPGATTVEARTPH